MTQEATRRWGLVGEFGGVAFEGYILGVHGGMEIGVFTGICAHVCMKVEVGVLYLTDTLCHNVAISLELKLSILEAVPKDSESCRRRFLMTQEVSSS